MSRHPIACTGRRTRTPSTLPETFIALWFVPIPPLREELKSHTLWRLQNFARMSEDCARPDSPVFQLEPFTTRMPKREPSIDLSFKFLLHDPNPTTVVPNPHESIHFYPTRPKKLSKKDTLTKVLRRMSSFPKFRSFSSPSSS